MFNNYKQNKILPSLSALALINTAAFSGIVAGQSQATVEEIVVTARKKAEGPHHLHQMLHLYSSSDKKYQSHMPNQSLNSPN